MTESDKLDYVRRQLEVFATIERTQCDEVGWIALKLSCTREAAIEWIAKAKGGAA